MVRTSCKFFAQGTCRNGNNCRFSHDAPFGGGGGNSSRNNSSRNSNGFGGNGNGNGNGGFGGGGNGSGSDGGLVAVSTMTEATRAVALEELRAPPIWELSGFSVTKGVRAMVVLYTKSVMQLAFNSNQRLVCDVAFN